MLHHNSPWAWGRAPSPAPRAYRLLENQPGGLQGPGGGSVVIGEGQIFHHILLALGQLLEVGARQHLGAAPLCPL